MNTDGRHKTFAQVTCAPGQTIQANLNTVLRDNILFYNMKCAEVVLPCLILFDGGGQSPITEGDTIEMYWKLAPSIASGHVPSGKTWRLTFEGSGWLRACVPLSPFSVRLRRDECGGRTSYSGLTISYCLTVYCAEGHHLAVLRRIRCFLPSASFPAACRISCSPSHFLQPVAARRDIFFVILFVRRWRQSICGSSTT